HRIPHLPIPVVISNNIQGISELVRHLVIRCQRRKIVFIRGIQGQVDAYEREDAFRRDLLRHNLDIPDSYFLEGEFSPGTAALAIREFLKTGAAFDAVLSADYLMAIAAKETLEAQHIRIPEQVSVVGFGDAPEAEKYGLTTVAADVRELGRRAAYQLISQMNGLAIRGVTTLSVELVIRKSCGCSK
ncbi:MAG: substrate-binding domain-containing protein, partial [Anaerolineae bacterium]|nr:substrate-binding domain-containing protein [Anaerolineae bacterium]